MDPKVNLPSTNFVESLANFVLLDEVSDNDEESEDDRPSIHVNDTSSTSSDSTQRECSNIFESLKEPAGAWGTHRFEKRPWSDDCRPCVKLEEYESSSSDEDEEPGLLTESVISSCLSYLERSPYDLNYVLCKCVLSSKQLSDISALMYYHYIQYLDLSWNILTTLSPLGQLPFLQHLDASHNKLAVLLDFKAPFYLSFVDFSYNLIESIPDLTEFWSITHLDISNNKVTKISGLESLRFLNYLNLSYNKIVTLENLNNLRIQFLILHHNIIKNSDDNMDLKSLDYIRLVDLSNNSISSLKIFKNVENLENINMSANRISSLLELYYLQNLMYLSRLNLSHNPVSKKKFYAIVCLRMIKNLMILDGKEINAESRIGTRTDYEIDPLLHAGESHIEIMLLQQLNYPAIGAHIAPHDQPPPIVFILVGPPGSSKKNTLKMICKTNKKCVLGVNHTTRPKTENEIDGEDYYFVSNEEFCNLTRKGQFIAVSEFNGHSYGIVHEELNKCEKGVLFFHSNLDTALAFRFIGVNPKFVLAMPRSETVHLNILKMKYYFDDTVQGVSRVTNCPDCIEKIASGPKKESLASVTGDNWSIIEQIILAVFELMDSEKVPQDKTFTRRGSTGTGDSVFMMIEGNIEDEAECHCGIESMESSSEAFQQRSSSGDKNIRVSFNEDTQFLLLKDKSDYAKDIIDIEVKGVSDQAVSNIVVCVKRRSTYDNPVLSVLSKNEDNSANEEVAFMKMEEFHLIQSEKLKTFFKKIIDSRAALFDLHWSNPGLFEELIFTDETEESMEKLKALVKLTIDNYKVMQPSLALKDYSSHRHITNARLKNLHAQEFAELKITWSGMHCKCDSPSEDNQDM